MVLTCKYKGQHMEEWEYIVWLALEGNTFDN